MGTNCDVLVVGGGPAGLSAAHALSTVGISCVVVDLGLPSNQRKHDKAEDLGVGVGGCGLFSDGKFSFRPSASHLWTLDDSETLAQAEAWATLALRDAGLTDIQSIPSAKLIEGQKQYPALYLPLDARRKLISRLEVPTRDHTFPLTKCTEIRWDSGEEIYTATLLNHSTNAERDIRSRGVVLATGRLGPVTSRQLVPVGAYVFRRVELGVRIEHIPGIGPLARCTDLDVKIIHRSEDAGIEWRTFCSCRNGEAVAIPYQGGWYAFSGRSDVSPTGRCNFGLNVRFTNPACGDPAWAALAAASREMSTCENVPLSEVLTVNDPETSPLSKYFGVRGWALMQEGLRNLVGQFPDLLHPETRLHGPTIEGVGYYPDIDNKLQLRDQPMWVSGDATGLFRGNVAAMISGHYVGQTAARRFKQSL